MSRDFVRYTPEIETIDPNPFQSDMSVVVSHVCTAAKSSDPSLAIFGSARSSS